MSDILALLSGLVMISVAFIYLKQVYDGKSIPNPATWIIWFAAMALNTSTYYFISHQSILAVLTPGSITLGILVILIYSSSKGRIGKVGFVEIVVLIASVITGIFWGITKDSALANLILQGIFLISFIPTVVGLLKGELKEGTASWNAAVLSYLLLIASVLTSTEWDWVQLAYPILNGVIGNGSVALIARLRRK